MSIRFFPFSRNIPWEYNKGEVTPNISKEIWNKYIKNKKCNIICPGYLLEAFMCLLAYDVLVLSGLKMDRIIMPEQYNGMAKLFGYDNLKTSKQEGDLPSEFNRLLSFCRGYLTPIFFDKDDNVYFNFLLNYGTTAYSGYFGYKIPKIIRNFPFHKQLFNNLCTKYNIRIKQIDNFESKKIIKKYLINANFKEDDKYILLDNASIFYLTSDNRKSKFKYIFPQQVKMLVDEFSRLGYKTIIMTNEYDKYKSMGMHGAIPAWINMPSEDVVSIMSGANGIISYDQNIYLLGALLGIKNVLSLEEEYEGWSFKDLDGLCYYDNCNWVYIKDNDISSIPKLLIG